jgi:hypothetical protein
MSHVSLYCKYIRAFYLVPRDSFQVQVAGSKLYSPTPVLPTSEFIPFVMGCFAKWGRGCKRDVYSKDSIIDIRCVHTHFITSRSVIAMTWEELR